MRRVRRTLAAVAALAGAVATACGDGGGLATRYALEKALYDAQQLEQRAYALYPSDDFAAWRAALDAYRAVQAFDRDSPSGDVASRRDCDRVRLEARIGELRLRYLDYRLHDAVTHAAVRGESIAGFAAVPWREPLSKTRVLYDSLGADPLGSQCRELMRSVASDPALWSGTELFRDSLLVIPLSLATVGIDAGGTKAAAPFVAFADSFYSRVVEAWPDSSVAGTVLDCRAQLRAAAGRFGPALEDVESALARDDLRAESAPRLRLLRGQLLAFAVRDSASARIVFDGVVARYPGTAEASTARLCRVLMREGASGHAGDLADALRALEMSDAVTDDVAAEVLLLHAAALENAGNWDDAAAMLWDTSRMYPYTSSALAAPLRIIRHLEDAGAHDDAVRAAKKASEYYLDLMRRDSALIRPRDITKDFFIEANLLVGDAAGAADRLERASGAWMADNAAVARLKSALIYNYILGERENSVGIMQKSLALFSRSRYLRATQRELVRITPARGGDTDTDSPGGSR